jgi:multiple sugar transport system substrate-binding protein
MIIPSRKRRSSKLIIGSLSLAVFGSAVLTGCGSQQETPGGSADAPVKDTPVTLKIALPGWVTEQEYVSTFVDPLKKTHPQTTLEPVKFENIQKLTELVSSGTIPDLIVSSVGLQEILELNMAYDMEPLIKKYQIPLESFDQAGLEAIRTNSGMGKLIAIPYTVGFQALYYNKDLFDKFGVAYPKAGITWEQVVSLTRQLTKTVDGVQYAGMIGATPAKLGGQLSLPLVDPKTGKAATNTDGWKKVFSTLKDIYTIPGNEQSVSFGQPKFNKDRVVAMMLANNTLRNLPEDLNWDITSMPVFSDKPGTGGSFLGVVIGVTSQSVHKDQAFQLIQTIMMREPQLQMVKDGRPSPLNSKEFISEFARNIPNSGSKKLSDIFTVKFAPPAAISPYDTIAVKGLDEAYKEVVLKGKDINTALREAEEKINNDIAAQRK